MSPEHRSPTHTPESRGSSDMHDDPESTKRLRRVGMHEKPGYEGQSVYVVDVNDHPDLKAEIFGDDSPHETPGSTPRFLDNGYQVKHGNNEDYAEQTDLTHKPRHRLTFEEELTDSEVAGAASEKGETLVSHAREVLGSVALRLSEVRSSIKTLKERYDAADPSHEGRHRSVEAGRHRSTLKERLGIQESYKGRHRATLKERVGLEAPEENGYTVRLSQAANAVRAHGSELMDSEINRIQKLQNFEPIDLRGYPDALDEAEVTESSEADNEIAVFKGNLWEATSVDGENVTLKRVNGDNEVELQETTADELEFWGSSNPDPEDMDKVDDPDKTQEIEIVKATDAEDERSLIQKFRELPLTLSARRAVRRHVRDESMTEQQRDDRRRRLRIAAVAATAAGVVLAAKYGHENIWGPADSSSLTDGSMTPNKSPQIDQSHLDVADMFEGKKGSTDFTKAGMTDFKEWFNSADGKGYTIKKGDTIWSISEKYEHARGIEDPTKYQTDAVKDDVLRQLRKQGVVKANGHLRAGVTIKLK